MEHIEFRRSALDDPDARSLLYLLLTRRVIKYFGMSGKGTYRFNIGLDKGINHNVSGQELLPLLERLACESLNSSEDVDFIKTLLRQNDRDIVDKVSYSIDVLVSQFAKYDKLIAISAIRKLENKFGDQDIAQRVVDYMTDTNMIKWTKIQNHKTGRSVSAFEFNYNHEIFNLRNKQANQAKKS